MFGVDLHLGLIQFGLGSHSHIRSSSKEERREIVELGKENSPL